MRLCKRPPKVYPWEEGFFVAFSLKTIDNAGKVEYCYTRGKFMRMEDGQGPMARHYKRITWRGQVWWYSLNNRWR